MIVEAREQRLFIGTYSPHHSLIMEVPTDWDDFKIVLTGEVSQELLKVMKETISFTPSDDGQTVTVHTAGTKLNLRTLDKRVLTLGMLAKQFVHNKTWEMSGTDLADAVTRIRHSANNAAISDVVMKSYHISHLPKDGGVGVLELMTTTGSSMSLTTLPVGSTDEFGVEKITVIISPEFHQIAALVDGGNVTFGLADGVESMSVTCEYPDEDTILRAITARTTGTPIPYESVLGPLREEDKFFTIDRKEFLEAVSHANFFSSKSSSRKLDALLADKKLVLSANNAHGSTSTQIKVEDQVRGLTFSISGDLLRSYLSSSKGGKIEVFGKDNSTPLLFKDGLSEEVISLYFR